MGAIREIFVSLLDEGVEVWRPVQAEHLRDNVYRIANQSYDEKIETWQFPPGSEVVCEIVNSSDGPMLAATRKA